MTTEVALYLAVLVVLNYGITIWFYRKDLQWEMVLLLGGFFWFIEAFMIAQFIQGGFKYDPIIKAFSITTAYPVPYALSVFAMLFLAVKQFRNRSRISRQEEEDYDDV